MTRKLVPLAMSLVLTAHGELRPEPCGTSRERTHVAVAIAKQGGPVRRSWRLPQPVADLAAGDIAVLDSSGGVVTTPSPFDMALKTVRFTPAASPSAGYRVETLNVAFDAATATGTEVRIGDDDTREVALDFEFPYFGRRYSRVWLNSDGNLTFVTGDGSSSERSLGRLIGGPPRIAGLFRDLDPSAGGRVLADPARGTFTWIGVPEFGSRLTQSFQIQISPSGTIEFRFGEVGTNSAVIGISPGRTGPLELVNLSALDGGRQFAGAVAESFDIRLSIDLARAAQRFYELHEDSYDYLMFFNSMGIVASSGAIAFQVPVRVTGSGYGLEAMDAGAEFGSPRRLQSVLNMGPLSQYPEDPYAVLPSAFVSGFTPMSIYAHEVGHQYLAFTRFPGGTANALLGRGLAHWSFFYHSEASIMEGNRIEDRGTAVTPRFLTGPSTQGLSMLDQYLMGLAAPEEVPASFFVSPRSSFYRAADGPRPGATFDGERIDVSVDSIIEANGRRTPDVSASQRRFRMAFVLITRDSAPLPEADLAKLDRHRREFERYFARITSGRAAADTTLRLAMDVLPGPAAGFISGTGGSLRLNFAAELSQPLALRIWSTDGRVTTPEALVVPPGFAGIDIPVRALQSGTDVVRIEAERSEYEVAEVRMRIARENEVRITASRQGSQVRIRVSDMNKLAYPGLSLVSDEGSTQTDERGEGVLTASPGSSIRVSGTTIEIRAP